MPGIETSAGKGGFDSIAGERALKAKFAVGTLDGFGAPGRAELAAAGGLLAYLDATQKNLGLLLSAPRRVARGTHMAIDPASRELLEICRSAERRRCRQPAWRNRPLRDAAGRRLLAADLSAPLLDRAAIEARLALVQFFHDDQLRREHVREALKAMPDIGRALGRLAAGRGGPRDLAQLRDGLAGAAALQAQLEAMPGRPDLLAELMPDWAAMRRSSTGWRRRWSKRRRSMPPRAVTSRKAMTRRSTPCARHPRTGGGRSRRWRHGIGTRPASPTLKIRHNAVLGYHIEVAARHADRLMAADSGFTHRQTLAGVVRFNSPDLHEEAGRVVRPGRMRWQPKPRILEELTALAVAASTAIVATADAIARIDVAVGNAARAAEGSGACRRSPTNPAWRSRAAATRWSKRAGA